MSDEIIKKVNGNEKSTWKAGRNARFEGMTLGEIAIYYACPDYISAHTAYNYRCMARSASDSARSSASARARTTGAVGQPSAAAQR